MTYAGKHDPLAVANYFLTSAMRAGKSLSIMQLTKLVYIAHGWSMAYFDKGLTNREPEAWMYGPVYPSVYNRFRGSGSSPISRLALSQSGNTMSSNFEDSERKLMDSVYENYGDVGAFTLSDFTHKSGTPWDITYKRSGSYSPIPNELIAKHYNELRQQRS